jgi:hypothetical protein
MTKQVVQSSQIHPQTIDLSPYRPRLLEPWISSEHACRDSELIHNLLGDIEPLLKTMEYAINL